MQFDDQRPLLLARGVRLQTDPTNGEPILLFPEGVMYLSATADDIVRRCDGRATARDIIIALAQEYDTDPATLRQDVIECLVELQQRKLLVLSE